MAEHSRPTDDYRIRRKHREVHVQVASVGVMRMRVDRDDHERCNQETDQTHRSPAIAREDASDWRESGDGADPKAERDDYQDGKSQNHAAE